MKVTEIYIANFRALRRVSIPHLDSHVNLFVGGTGSGKTSLIMAMAMVFSWYNRQFTAPVMPGKHIREFDIHTQAAVGTNIELTIDDVSTWGLSRLKGGQPEQDLGDMIMYAAPLKVKYDAGEYVSIPIISATLMHEYPFELLNRNIGTINRCMRIMMPEFSDLKLHQNSDILTVRKGDFTLSYYQLSEGERVSLSIISAIILNISFGKGTDDPLLRDAVVMLDDFDRHLDPAMQRVFVSRLVKAFPNCQFFLTAKSPLVASDVKGKVFSLSACQPLKTFGKRTSDILLSAFGIGSDRCQDIQSLIDKGYKALSSGDDALYNECMQTLIEDLGPDDVDITGLRLEKARRSRLKDQG